MNQIFVVSDGTGGTAKRAARGRSQKINRYLGRKFQNESYYPVAARLYYDDDKAAKQAAGRWEVGDQEYPIYYKQPSYKTVYKPEKRRQATVFGVVYHGPAY